MGTATVISIIGIVLSAISVSAVIYFNSKGSKKTDIREIEERVRDNTAINMKLDAISSTTQDIKTEISSMRDDIKSHNDRLARLEESLKTAHKRIDGLQERIDKEE